MVVHEAILNSLRIVRPPDCPSDQSGCPAFQALAEHVQATPGGLGGQNHKAEIAKRTRELFDRIRETPCQRCLFYFLVKAIEQTVPGDEIPSWMERPNLDLDGRTPISCVDEGRYEEVFEALWLMSDPGPSS